MQFDTTLLEAQTITLIAKRAWTEAAKVGVHYPFHEADMDLTVTHCNGCALDLQRLLDASAEDFNHDISGIYRHLNRETGQLEGCFSPRYALAPVTTA